MQLKLNVTYLLFFLTTFNFNAQEKMACLQFDKQKIKILLVELKDKKKKDFKLRNFWTEIISTNEASSQEITGALQTNLKKLNLENNIQNKSIYILSDSQIFSNEEILFIQQQLVGLGCQNIEFLTLNETAKVTYEGLALEDKSVVLHADRDYAFLYGEAYNEITKNSLTSSIIPDSNPRKNTSTEENSTIKTNREAKLKELYSKADYGKKNHNFYLSGDWAWAFFSLYNGGTIQNEFSELKISDLEKHQENLETKFARYQGLATANIEAERVLQNFSQEELLMGNTILLQTLKNISTIEDKKIFYCRSYNTARLIFYLKTKI